MYTSNTRLSSILVHSFSLNCFSVDIGTLVEISPLKMERKTETGHWTWLVIRHLRNAFFYQLLPFYMWNGPNLKIFTLKLHNNLIIYFKTYTLKK